MFLSMLQSYLYGERVEHVSYSEFVNKELILFSNADNERSIPSLVDGKSNTILLSIRNQLISCPASTMQDVQHIDFNIQ